MGTEAKYSVSSRKKIYPYLRKNKNERNKRQMTVLTFKYEEQTTLFKDPVRTAQ